MFTSKKYKDFSVKAYQGDAKTLLAFNLPEAKRKTSLPGARTSFPEALRLWRSRWRWRSAAFRRAA